MRVLLFNDFPFDFQWRPPLDLGNGLRAIEVRQHEVAQLAGETLRDHALRKAITLASLMPWSGSRGVGHINFALTFTPDGNQAADDADEVFFRFLAALRLWRPLPIDVASTCERGPTGMSGVAERLRPRRIPAPGKLGAAACRIARRDRGGPRTGAADAAALGLSDENRQATPPITRGVGGESTRPLDLPRNQTLAAVPQLPRPATTVGSRYFTQFCNLSPDTRANPRSLFVTSTTPSASACDAIQRSLPPIGLPCCSRVARSVP